MIELARHIEILLLDNDCVIVPGFGGFMTHHVESCYSLEENIFLPPCRTLGFNPQLQVNDSLLAQSYVEAYNISYPEAIFRIEDEVREIRKILANEGVYELNNIGTISANDEGNYVFEPCSAGVLTPSLYALTSFSMPIVEKNVVKNISEKLAGNGIVEETSCENQTTVIPLISHTDEKANGVISDTEIQIAESSQDAKSKSIIDTEDEEENSNVITISISTLRKIAVAVFLILVAVVTTLHFSTDNTTKQIAGVDTELLQKIMPQMQTTPVDKIEKNITKSTKETQRATNDNATQNDKTQKTEEVDKHELKSTWVIVLASHVSGKNAELYVNQLKEDGIVSARMINKGHKIVCGSFESEAEAHSYIKILQDKSSHCEDCWITEIKE